MARKRKTFIALGAKLRAIRAWKMLTQSEILRVVLPIIAETKPQFRAMVSQWEYGTREPTREALIRYARLAEINVEDLMIDENRLPAHISSAVATASRNGTLVAGRVKKQGHKKTATNEMATVVVDDANAETDAGAEAETGTETKAGFSMKNGDAAAAQTSARFEKSDELWFSPIEGVAVGKSGGRDDRFEPNLCDGKSRDIEEASERENKTDDLSERENEINKTKSVGSSIEIESDAKDSFVDENKNANVVSNDFPANFSGDDSRNISNGMAAMVSPAIEFTKAANESAIFGLPAQTLDELHDVHLKLLMQLPRRLRSSLTVSHIVDVGIKLVLLDYEKRSDGGLLGERVRKIKRDSTENKS